MSGRFSAKVSDLTFPQHDETSIQVIGTGFAFLITENLIDINGWDLATRKPSSVEVNRNESCDFDRDVIRESKARSRLSLANTPS